MFSSRFFSPSQPQLLDFFLKVNEHFSFFAFKWSQKIVFFLFCACCCLRDFSLLNDHQSACVSFGRKERRKKKLLRFQLWGAMRESVINWCDLRTFYNDPKFLHLIDFDFWPKKGLRMALMTMAIKTTLSWLIPPRSRWCFIQPF